MSDAREETRGVQPGFTLEAVRLITEGHRPVSEVARELALRPEQLREWRRPLAPEAVTPPRSEAEELGAAAAGVGGGAPGAGLPRKSGGVLREPARVKYACIARYLGQYPLCLMCRVLGGLARGLVRGAGARAERAGRE